MNINEDRRQRSVPLTEDINIKSKKRIKTNKKKSFKSSLEKLFHLKLTNEKPVKHDDILSSMIPQTLYLSPQQTGSDNIRHSCSDYSCRRSNTFCMLDRRNVDNTTRSISPLSNVFYPLKEKDIQESSKVNSVLHSNSVPSRLSKSHLNIAKSNFGRLDVTVPSKRSLKKSIFNCSLFRRRSHSHSKLRDTVRDGNAQNYAFRCLTLPNLKANEVDVALDPLHPLFSMDLIKDYMNRSENSLQSSGQRISVGNYVEKSPPPHCRVVNKSPHPLFNCNEDVRRFKTPTSDQFGQRVPDNPLISANLYSQVIELEDRKRCQNSSSPLTIDNSVSANQNRRPTNGPSTSIENKLLGNVRQITPQIQYQPRIPPQRYFCAPPTDSAFEFWTRPFQEKLKASRRRHLDDKVGSNEAFLRHHSPQNPNTNDHQRLDIIAQPENILQKINATMKLQSPMSHSQSFSSTVHGRQPNFDNVFPKNRAPFPANPVIENRLLESPQQAGDNRLSCSIDHFNGISGSNVFPDDVTHGEMNLSSCSKILALPRKSLCNFSPGTKDVNSSTECVLTRTPTPPHSFAESCSSIVYPAPNEFLTDATPPIPPPRSDSVLRSLRAMDDYVATDVFSGANIGRYDARNYHQWLEKLPYQPSSQLRAKTTDHSTNMDRLLLPRKSIKSWTTSDSSRPEDATSSDSQLYYTPDSSSLKRSFSFDQCLQHVDNAGRRDSEDTPAQTSFKQYSHLYSLKTSPVCQETNADLGNVFRSAGEKRIKDRSGDISGNTVNGTTRGYKMYPMM